MNIHCVEKVYSDVCCCQGGEREGGVRPVWTVFHLRRESDNPKLPLTLDYGPNSGLTEEHDHLSVALTP